MIREDGCPDPKRFSRGMTDRRTQMIKIIVFLLIGALIGCIAGKIMGNEKQGFIRNALLGLIGSFVGGLIGNLLKIGGGWISGIILSVLGACLVLFLIEKLKK
jgi:uncharacterized membrane protein YeaQ/YmgE (transglycosylase-associated protein family)